MKKKKLIIGSLVAAMLAPISLCFTGCKEEKPFDINAKDVYAMCAASSVEYLKNIDVNEPQPVSKVVPVNSVRPTIVEDEDIAGIKNSLSMFDEIVKLGIAQTTEINTSNIIGFKDYKFVMEINFPKMNGAKSYTLYYDEINSRTEEEIDDAKLEVEVSTLIDGLLVADGEHYIIKGEREFERDGNEKESSIRFTTYLDEENYITIEQSVEDDEIEYSYSIYENDIKVQETEFEIEKTKRGYELEFKMLNLNSSPRSTEYNIYINNNSEIVVVLRKNREKETITVEQQEDGYNFIYSNGFSEIV